ncbi:hypothetical protein J3R82DRAFT_171 [Butyriboletus roseoflavus]|nr:hypothetical protein J3R82DRAFT_171 [Butyriboletus roseoflavus]
MPGAENKHCHANDNDMLAHFKVHIYNKVSLSNVALAFLSQEGPSRGSAKPSKEVDANEVVIVEMPDLDDHSCVCNVFVAALKMLGCKWVSEHKLFPWKGLSGKLAFSRVVCHNFPDSVPFPEEERLRLKSGSKGIANISLADCSVLIAILNNLSANRLHFKRNPDWIDDLHASHLPVIIGGSTQSDSLHAFAKRMFADGMSDRTGPPYRLTGGAVQAATHVKKKKLLAMSAHQMITIADSDSDTPIRKGKGKERMVIADPDDNGGQTRGKGKRQSMNLVDGSVKVQELPPPAVKKRCLPDRKGCPLQAKKACMSPADDDKDKVQDISFPSGSEFYPEEKEKKSQVVSDADEAGTPFNDSKISEELMMLISRKRKAKVDRSQWSAKKHIIVKVPHLLSFTSKQKGKAPECIAKKRHGAFNASLSKEVSLSSLGYSFPC